MRHFSHCPFLSFLLFLAASFLLCTAEQASAAGFLSVPRPADRQFVLDLANIISEQDEAAIQKQCDSLLTEKMTPIIVVTVESMAKYGGEGLTIQKFSKLLFNEWQIGQARAGDGSEWDTGMLLIVSKGDRKARIELGKGWGTSENHTSKSIMDDLIVPKFRKGKSSEGIVAGVNALDKLARKLEIPTSPRPWWHYALFAAAIAMAVVTVVSLVQRGSGGWAWLFWGLIFSGIGAVLFSTLSSSGGGGFSGGSFGGGSSGGGGATGSW